MNHSPQSQAKWLQFLMIIVIALGICFRWANLDQKPYWHDETFTSLRVSGYRLTEATKQLYSGQEISVADLRHYQGLASGRSAIETMQRLAEEVPQHPPLYFVIARFWAQAFGSSITAVRSLSVLTSLLLLPAVYWLCLELFASAMVGWMAVALFAVSPIYVHYAQEARPYSLWTVLIVLSSIALLRALRHPQKWHWGIYAITVMTSLYCHIFSGFVFLGHGIYVMAIERFRVTKAVTGYFLASLIGIFCFTPWLWVIWHNYDAVKLTTDWIKQPLPVLTLVRYWSVNLSQIMIAWHFRYDPELAYLVVPILILIIVAITVLYRQTAQRVWLFVLILVGVPALALVLPDLLWAGKRSANARYLLPSFVGIQLAIAYLLSHQLTQKFTTIVHRRSWRIVTALIITSSVLTCAVSSQATTWWGWSEFDVEVSRIVNRSAQPLIISEMPFGMIMPLGHRLHPNTKLLLTAPETLKISNRYSDVFIYNPSDRLHAKLRQQGLQSELVYQFRDGSFIVSLYHLSGMIGKRHVRGSQQNESRRLGIVSADRRWR
jgi:uncharacterized membrane protein